MPRDLVTDPGEKRDWLEKCRLNKLKVLTLLTMIRMMICMKRDWLEKCQLNKLKVLNMRMI